MNSGGRARTRSRLNSNVCFFYCQLPLGQSPAFLSLWGPYGVPKSRWERARGREEEGEWTRCKGERAVSPGQPRARAQSLITTRRAPEDSRAVSAEEEQEKQQREPCKTQGKTNSEDETAAKTGAGALPKGRDAKTQYMAGDLQGNTRRAEWGGCWPRAQGAWCRALGAHPPFPSLTVLVCKRGKARNCDSGTMGSRPDKTQVRSPSCTLHQNKFQMD